MRVSVWVRIDVRMTMMMAKRDKDRDVEGPFSVKFFRDDGVGVGVAVDLP